MKTWVDSNFRFRLEGKCHENMDNFVDASNDWCKYVEKRCQESLIRASLIDRRSVGYGNAVFRRSEDEADCNAKEANQTNTG